MTGDTGGAGTRRTLI